MSLPRKDFRCELTADVHAVLEAVANVRGVTMGDIVRDLLADWAQEQVHNATVLHNALVKAGIVPNGAGSKRSAAE